MDNIKGNKIVRDLKRIICVSSLFVLVLICVMVFSPLATQFNEDYVSRGTTNEWEIDSLMQNRDYQAALLRVDSVLVMKSCNLPRLAYFDRFLSEKERYGVSVQRAEIYDLQWKRIEILQAKNDYALLEKALEDYIRIIGYNQQRAKALLNQVKEDKQ